MGVYLQLSRARVRLLDANLKKTGENVFAKYKYWELSDFLPTTLRIFDELGLCGVVSFTDELATLTIVDTKDLSELVITSPMREANLKNCHPIQNLGAVETYQTRYLWSAAMALTESDALDAGGEVAGSEQQSSNQRQSGRPVTKAELSRINDLLEKTGSDKAAFCQHFNITCVPELASADYKAAFAMLEKKAKHQAGQQSGEGQSNGN